MANKLNLYFINSTLSNDYIFEFNDGTKDIKEIITKNYYQYSTDLNYLSFKISKKNIYKHYNILLLSQHTNKIGFYLNDTFDLNNIYIHIKIKYCKEISFKINYLDINQKIIFDCDFNSLNFDKFILFNTPLNFKLSSIIFLLNFFEFEKIEQSNKLGT